MLNPVADVYCESGAVTQWSAQENELSDIETSHSDEEPLSARDAGSAS